MSDVNYDRQESLNGLSIPATITIIGTGGFGGWVAFFAALSGVKKLILFSEGNVKETDLARLPYESRQIGQPHSEAIAEVIKRLRADAVVEPHGPFDPNKHAEILEGIVFNGAPSRELEDSIVKITNDKGLKYFSGVYHHLNFGVFDFTPNNLLTTDEPGAFWVGIGAMSASLALYSAFFETVNFYGSPSDLNISKEKIERGLGSIDGLFHDR